MLEPYLRQWGLTPAGELIVAQTSQLLPVLSQGQSAMLKVTGDADERHGHLLMRWWAGTGAARMLPHDRSVSREVADPGSSSQKSRQLS